MKWQPLICAIFLGLALATLAQAELFITVPDAGFDDHVLPVRGYAYIGEGDYAGDGDYTGPWQSAGGDAWIDHRYYVAIGDFLAVSANNKLYGFENAEDDVYQILEETFIEGATYRLSAQTGSAWSGYADGWWLYFTGQENTSHLAEASGNGPVGAWKQVSLVYTATADDAGHRIGIKLKGDAWVTFDDVTLSYVIPVTIPVDPESDLAAANAAAQSGDTILFSEGTYHITAPIEIKDGVTYQGAGPGLTIIDGNELTRAFVAWGDRTYNNTNENTNDSGPKDWVLDGLTIQNCVADGNDIFAYAGAAYNMKEDFADNDADASGGLDIEEADDDAGAIRLPGPDGIEQSIDDDIHRFVAMDTDNSGELSEAELDAQLLSEEVEFGNQQKDGGAVFVGNVSLGTIQNCEFLNNYSPIDGDDGGAISIAGESVVTINDCNFMGNHTLVDDGGALNVAGLAVVTINDCKFDGNYAASPNASVVRNPQPDGDGGHIKVQGSSASALTPGTTLIVNRCKFYNGKAEDDGGALQAWGIGTILRFDACWFSGNAAADNGTVLSFGHEELGELTVTNCGFSYNISTFDSDRMIEARRNSKFINCTFVGNNQGDQALIHNNADSADTDKDGTDDEFTDTIQVVNCLFVNNVVGEGDQILRSRNTSFRIAATNCLFFGNTRQNGTGAPNVQANRG
ncbi:MAG: hypothetical protein GY809_00445, partial [Planctomycetes bacterium]|nr:hypothetical protein [Planctomycetota bacterium]